MKPGYTVISLALAALIGRASPPAYAVCNLIPASERNFPSTLGTVTTPFASPGDPVTVLRDESVFDADPSANHISIRFQPPDGTVVDVTALAPSDEEGSFCRSRDCAGGTCRCVHFRFPDTDADVGTPDDGHTLTGPVTIEVETRGARTALIDTLLTPASRFPDPLLASFVALPRPNRFDDLLTAAGDVLAARDAKGNLFIPFDYAALLTKDPFLTRFIEARLPLLAGMAVVKIDSFTTDGRQLTPLLHRVPGTVHVIGTIDAAMSVLRVTNLPARGGPVPEPGGGPVVIPGVNGFADPPKRADIFPLNQRQGFAIYQTPERIPNFSLINCL